MSTQTLSIRRCGTLAVAALALSLLAAAGWAEHRMVKAQDLKWSAVPSLPPGAQLAVIEGPMNQAVPFTVRLKFPANYRLPPHTHPAVERVSVLSGTFHMGMGEKFDQGRTMPVEPGDIMIMHPGTVHFAWTDTDTVVQLHGTGPWGITYVNPSDDPRKN
jgi:quercetin dioxygenase-like cupin family protein